MNAEMNIAERGRGDDVLQDSLQSGQRMEATSTVAKARHLLHKRTQCESAR